MVEVAAVAFAAIQNYNERKRIANESNWYFWAQTEEDKETAVEALAVRGFSVPNDDSPRYRYIYFDTVMDAFNTVFSRPGRVSKQIEVSSLEEFIARIESNRRYTPVVATASAEVH